MTDIDMLAFSVEGLKRDADEMAGWGAGNEAAHVRWAAAEIERLRQENEALKGAFKPVAIYYPDGDYSQLIFEDCPTVTGLAVVVEPLYDMENRTRIVGFQWSGERQESIARLRQELANFRALLKDPAAVRVNYLRGDIACQSLIDEARDKALEAAAVLIEQRNGSIPERQEIAAEIRALKGEKG